VLTTLKRYAEAERALLDALRDLAAAPDAAPRWRKECVEALITLYEEWNRAEPGKGHEASAAVWKEKRAAHPRQSEQ
jgi:hypothetical protein